MVFSPDGANLTATTAANDVDSTTAVLRTCRTADFTEAWALPLGPDPVTGLAISPDGRILATGDGEQIRFRDPANGEVLHDFGTPHPSVIRDLVFSPDGRTQASDTVDDPAVRLWNVADGGLPTTAAGLAAPPNDAAHQRGCGCPIGRGGWFR
ncbi:WD40 repeat domain-containing protein [Amycolatopsis lurida]